MSALDRVLALSRGEAVLDDEFLELTWSPEARAAALKSRQEHKHAVGDRVKLKNAMHHSGSIGTVTDVRTRKHDNSSAYIVKKDGGGEVHAGDSQLEPHTGAKSGERLSPNEQVKRANEVLNRGGSQREQSLAVLNRPSEAKAAKSDPLPGPKRDEAIKAGLRVPDKYSPAGAMVGNHTPQTHPEEFDSGEIKSEIKMLDRHDKKYGAHPLRAAAKNKLVAHLAEREKAKK